MFAAIEEGTTAANERLAERAALYPNLHVIDVDAMAHQWTDTGIAVGDETLWIAQYGGLVGLDGLHFTDTAYALLANAFIAAIEEVYGTPIPHIDVAAVRALDRERPSQLLAEGFDPSPCESFSANSDMDALADHTR